jgi:hypothetical protein
MPKTSIDPGVWQLNFSPPDGHGSTPAGSRKGFLRTTPSPWAEAEKNKKLAAGTLDRHDILWFKSVTHAKYSGISAKQYAQGNELPIISNR